MNYTTHNTDNNVSDQIIGTSLQGHVDAGYEELSGLFGNPVPSNSGKSDAEWHIRFEDGTVASVYNYKDGKNYRGKGGLSVDAIRDWHVGGFSRKAIDMVQIALDLRREGASKPEHEATDDPIKKAIFGAEESREAILNSLLAHKGEPYKNAVLAAVCAIKMTQLNSLLLSMLEDTGMPSGLRKVLHTSHGHLLAAMLSAAARNAGIDGSPESKATVDELMAWAEKINEIEQGAAKEIVTSMEKGSE